MSNIEKIESVREAVEIIANMIRQRGLRTTKLKNYGYYSFTVKNFLYRSYMTSMFNNDPRFEIEEKCFSEYIIKIKDIDIDLSLKYVSGKQNSKLILDRN